MDKTAASVETASDVWATTVLELPENEQILLLANIVVNGPPSGITMILDRLIQHHRVFDKIITNHNFSDRIQERIQQLTAAASKD